MPPLTAPAVHAPVEPRDLVLGLLAALASQRVTHLRSEDVHARFLAALRVWRALGGPLADAAEGCHVDIVHETVRALDDGLAAAQAAGFGCWRAPDYRTFEIQLSSRAVTRLLEERPRLRDGLLAGARAFQSPLDLPPSAETDGVPA